MKKDLSYNQIPENMERVQRILKHPEFETSMSAIRALEKERIFCCHGIAHCLYNEFGRRGRIKKRHDLCGRFTA